MMNILYKKKNSYDTNKHETVIQIWKSMIDLTFPSYFALCNFVRITVDLVGK